MATQIQTSAGDVVKAYDRKIPEAQRGYEEGVKEYEAAKEAWLARSAWYRFWHPSESPWRRFYMDEWHVRRLNDERSFYVGFTHETIVLMDDNQAMWLGIGDSSKVVEDER